MKSKNSAINSRQKKKRSAKNCSIFCAFIAILRGMLHAGSWEPFLNRSSLSTFSLHLIYVPEKFRHMQGTIQHRSLSGLYIHWIMIPLKQPFFHPTACARKADSYQWEPQSRVFPASKTSWLISWVHIQAKLHQDNLWNNGFLCKFVKLHEPCIWSIFSYFIVEKPSDTGDISWKRNATDPSKLLEFSAFQKRLCFRTSAREEFPRQSGMRMEIGFIPLKILKTSEICSIWDRCYQTDRLYCSIQHERWGRKEHSFLKSCLETGWNRISDARDGCWPSRSYDHFAWRRTFSI